MLDFDLIKNILVVAIASSIIVTALVQKIKEGFEFKNSKVIIIVSFLTSMIFGTLFSVSFSDLSIVYSIWVGFITFIGADAIYKAFEDKIFKSFGTIYDNKVIKIPIENEIKDSDV